MLAGTTVVICACSNAVKYNLLEIEIIDFILTLLESRPFVWITMFEECDKWKTVLETRLHISPLLGFIRLKTKVRNMCVYP